MTRLRGTLIAAAAVPLFLLGACARPVGAGGVADPSSGTPESAPASAPGGNALVLRVETFGGFVAPDRVIGRIPQVSVYGDGRVITEGPLPAIYPGPALPNVQVQVVSVELVQEMVREGLAAGVRSGTDYGRPGVADAPTTRVTVVTAGGTQSVTAEALNESQSTDPRLTAAQRQARAKLAGFVRKLSDLPAAEGMPPSVQYDPESVAVLARPWAAQDTSGPASPAKAFAGPALPGSYLNPSFKIGCVVATGAAKAKIMAAAKDATAITPWTQGSTKYLIAFRPLLPDETSCAALKTAA